MTASVERRRSGLGPATWLARCRTVFERVAVSPVSSWPLAISRIVLGLTILMWTLTLMPDVSTFFGDGAFTPESAANTESLFQIPNSTGAVWLALGVLVVCSIAVLVGYRPTAFLLVAFVLLVAVQRRNPVILNSGDLILRDLTLLLALTPTGAALSVDRWRAHGRASLWTAPLVAPWGLRLVQLQVTLVYLFAFWSKSGELWRNGTAVSTSLRLRDLQRFGEFDLLIEHTLVVAALTWGTLLLEVMLGLLLWVKRMRPVLIVGALLLHLMIDGLMLVGFFGPAMAAGLMVFLDGDAVQRRVSRRRGVRSRPVPNRAASAG